MILGNCAASSAQYRDKILKLSLLDLIIKVCKETTDKQIFKMGVWAASNLCRGTPRPPLMYVEKAIPFFCWVIRTETNKEILYDAFWAMAHLSVHGSQIQTIISTGVLPSLLHYVE